VGQEFPNLARYKNEPVRYERRLGRAGEICTMLVSSAIITNRPSWRWLGSKPVQFPARYTGPRFGAALRRELRTGLPPTPATVTATFKWQK
jgi:hypothetical protein